MVQRATAAVLSAIYEEDFLGFSYGFRPGRSPLLANLYLHYVFDLWAERWRRREAAGNMIIVRYADDLIVGFEHETDARRFLDEMRKRLQEFALSLHSEKTRLIEFGRFAAENRKRRGSANRRP